MSLNTARLSRLPARQVSQLGTLARFCICASCLGLTSCDGRSLSCRLFHLVILGARGWRRSRVVVSSKTCLQRLLVHLLVVGLEGSTCCVLHSSLLLGPAGRTTAASAIRSVSSVVVFSCSVVSTTAQRFSADQRSSLTLGTRCASTIPTSLVTRPSRVRPLLPSHTTSRHLRSGSSRHLSHPQEHEATQGTIESRLCIVTSDVMTEQSSVWNHPFHKCAVNRRFGLLLRATCEQHFLIRDNCSITLVGSSWCALDDCSFLSLEVCPFCSV